MFVKKEFIIKWGKTNKKEVISGYQRIMRVVMLMKMVLFALFSVAIWFRCNSCVYIWLLLKCIQGTIIHIPDIFGQEVE